MKYTSSSGTQHSFQLPNVFTLNHKFCPLQTDFIFYNFSLFILQIKFDDSECDIDADTLSDTQFVCMTSSGAKKYKVTNDGNNPGISHD